MGVYLWGTILCGFDVCFRRLPDWLTLPAAVVAAYWYPNCVWGGLLWAALYSRRGIGGGDVKLALSLGTVALAGNFLALLMAIALASLLTVAGCALMRRRSLPHGPSMIVATWLAAFVLPSGQIGGISY